jgi:hypothetical protein
MRRILTLTTATLALCAIGSAQTITQANAVPPFGSQVSNRYFAEDVPWSLLDTVGSGLNWDISGLNFEANGLMEMFLLDVASSSYALDVPEASILLEEIVGEITYLSFFNNNAGQLDLVAFGYDNGDDTEIFEACPTLQMTYPGVLNTTVTPSLVDCGNELVDYERKILANGNFVTPFGTLPNVVLIRTRRCEIYEDDGQWVTACYNTYDWFNEGNILTPVMNVDLNGATAVVVLNFPSGINGIQESATGTLELAPNPAKDHLTIASRDGQPLGEVRIHAADGRLVRELGRVALDRLTIDVQDLQPGLYTVSCIGGEAPVVLRFVKE